MYISLNLKDMTVMHIHPVIEAVTMLAYLECDIDAEYEIFNATIEDFTRFTDMERRILYENLTGVKVQFKNVSEARALIYNAIDSCGIDRCNQDKLELQVAYKEKFLEEQSNSRHPQTCYFRYRVKGNRMHVPEEADTPTPDCKTAALDADVVQRILAGDYPVIEERVSKLPHMPVADPVVPSHPRGGVRARVWEVANEVWERMGKPTDIPVLLEMRKGIMDDLEQEGVKRTSASTALGDWQKSILASSV